MTGRLVYVPYLTVSSNDEASCRRFVAGFFGIEPRRIMRVTDTGNKDREGVPIFRVYVLRSVTSYDSATTDE